MDSRFSRYPSLMASSGDYLRIWNLNNESVKMECLLNTNKDSDFCAPITSFDWNEVDPNLIGTASIDTTCTIWSIETGQEINKTSPLDCQNNKLSNSKNVKLPLTHFYAQHYKISGACPLINDNIKCDMSAQMKTQIIAHDKEVFDLAFSGCAGGRDMFATAGADASVRIFDLRHLEHSTIIYEHPKGNSLVRLAWNREDSNYLAVLPSGADEILILDIRMPLRPAAATIRSYSIQNSDHLIQIDETSTHLNDSSNLCIDQNRKEIASINAFAWAPHSSSHLCTVSDDKQAMIWDIRKNNADIQTKSLNNLNYGSPFQTTHFNQSKEDASPLYIVPILAYTAIGEINQVQWSISHPEWISICYGNILEMLRV
ncbi:DDB1- and CUL4-associated factor 7-like isoform X2 [Gordionus sp. m RMFG-2023]|uniref:DDB1- and CUL4-associated factor 7-like isoform X2 n=1 Tax=Gordionus sp. m RMFG-2023 TaxID=3053472 RepID=UPI0031FC14D8